jgi:hypothetical protein
MPRTPLVRQDGPGHIINANDGNEPDQYLAWLSRGVHTAAEHGAKGDGSNDDSSLLTNTDAAAGTTGVAALGPTSAGYRVAQNTTLTAGWDVPPGAQFKPDSGKTLTINGPLRAGPYQIFGGAGTVALGPGSVEHVYLEWWAGSLAAATPTACVDASAALTKALAAVPANKTLVVHLLPGYYAMNGLINQSFVKFVGPGKTMNLSGNNAPSAIVPFNHANPALQIGNATGEVVDTELSGITFLATAADGGTGVTGLSVQGGSKRGRFDVASFGFTGDCILVQGDTSNGTYDNRFYDPKVQCGVNGNGIRVVWGGAFGCTDTTLITPMFEGAATGTGFPLVVDGCTVKCIGGYLQSSLTGGAGVKMMKTATSGAQAPFVLNFGMDIDSNTSTDTLITLDATCPSTWNVVADPMPGLYNCDGVMLLADGVTRTPHIGQIAALPSGSQAVNPTVIGALDFQDSVSGTLFTDTVISASSSGVLNLWSHGGITMLAKSGIVAVEPSPASGTIELDLYANSILSQIKVTGGLLALLPGTALALGNPSPATTATTAFPYIPVMAGTPTGVPTAETGYAPLVFDSVAKKLWAYLGGSWVGVALT